MNSKKKLKTYNITYRPDESNRYKTETITYQANDMKEAEALFHAEHPEHKNSNKQRYLEIHSPLENYAIDAENQKIVENPNNNDTNNNSNTTNDVIPHQFKMKKFNILNIFKLVNDYIQQITMLIVGLIPLLLLGVVLFGDNFFLGNIVVYNIQNILDSMAGFVGLITLLVIVHVYYKFSIKN